VSRHRKAAQIIVRQVEETQTEVSNREVTIMRRKALLQGPSEVDSVLGRSRVHWMLPSYAAG
jgi:hypothetical protein